MYMVHVDRIHTEWVNMFDCEEDEITLSNVVFDVKNL